MIEPTIGRNVYYVTETNAVLMDEEMVQRGKPNSFATAPMLAFITYVWSTTCVNLLVVDHDGYMHRRTSVPINTGTPSFPRAEWMDYQKGQAAKQEELAQKLEQAIAGQIDQVVSGAQRREYPKENLGALDGHEGLGKLQASTPSPMDGKS